MLVKKYVGEEFSECWWSCMLVKTKIQMYVDENFSVCWWNYQQTISYIFTNKLFDQHTFWPTYFSPTWRRFRSLHGAGCTHIQVFTNILHRHSNIRTIVLQISNVEPPIYYWPFDFADMTKKALKVRIIDFLVDYRSTLLVAIGLVSPN